MRRKVWTGLALVGVTTAIAASPAAAEGLRSQETTKRSCNQINLGGPRVFYKRNMRCETAKDYARRVYRTDGRYEPRNFDCEGTISHGAQCRHEFKNKVFGWHPFD